MVQAINSDYILKHRYPVDLCNGEVWCSLWGTDWTFKDELRFQTVNDELNKKHTWVMDRQ
jgi:hypothetical protein